VETIFTKMEARRWQEEWEAYGARKRAATWKTPWKEQTLKHYDGLHKAEATALFLMRRKF
jgi:hypothetical protein